MGSKKSNTEEAAPAAPAERKAIEQWAEELGHLPQFLGGNTLGGQIPNPAYWKYQAARDLMKARNAWKDGQQVTREEFEAAFREYDALRFG